MPVTFLFLLVCLLSPPFRLSPSRISLIARSDDLQVYSTNRRETPSLSSRSHQLDCASAIAAIAAVLSIHNLINKTCGILFQTQTSCEIQSAGHLISPTTLAEMTNCPFCIVKYVILLFLFFSFQCRHHRHARKSNWRSNNTALHASSVNISIASPSSSSSSSS